jgi:murein DD-endopeptidase MepM/ murein hydrolase activator NlpD
MPTPAENAALIRRRAQEYALANGGSEADAEALAQAMIAIAWVESGLGQQPVGDQGQSHGLFHTHVGGRNLSGVGRRARSAGELAAVLRDPETDVANSLPELWQHVQRHGGATGFQRDPASFVANVALTGQRPDRNAWARVVQQGGYAQGLQYARGADVPRSGSPLQAAAGLPSGAASGGAAAVRVNPTPVPAPITSRFGTPFPMDSGATYQGQRYAHFNKGVDFGAPGGTPVQAVVGGTVRLAADDGQGWGPRVVIVDPEGFEHSYGHLGELVVRPGQTVEAGEVIGAVGSGRVGTSTGAHLSYDVFRGGEPVDPSPWLGQDVKDPAIRHDPARAQVPGYLAGGAARGGAMTTGGSGNAGFFNQQIEDAKRQIAWAEWRKAEIAAGRGNGNPTADEEELAFLNDRIAQETDRIGNFQAALINEQKLNPAAQGPNPIEQAAGIQGIRAQQNEHNRWLYDTFLGLMDTTFKNQLGVSGLLRDIFKINEDNAQAAVDSAIAVGALNRADREAVVQARAMQQTAEAARALQALQRAQWINDTDFRNAERKLPPGTHYVPGLEPSGALMTAMRTLGLPGEGLRATPTDWAALDPRVSLGDAEATLPAVPDFGAGEIERVAQRNEQIQPYRPGTLTAKRIGVPQAPDLTQYVPALPGASQAGGITDDDLIDLILGRGRFAPPLPAAGTTPGVVASGPNPTNAPLGPDATGFIEAEAAAHVPVPLAEPAVTAEQADRLLNPGRALQQPPADAVGQFVSRALDPLTPRDTAPAGPVEAQTAPAQQAGPTLAEILERWGIQTGARARRKPSLVVE